MDSNSINEALSTIQLTQKLFPIYAGKANVWNYYNQAIKSLNSNKKKDEILNLRKYISSGLKINDKVSISKEDELKTLNLLGFNLY